jgi:hypothetical protein
VQTEQGKALYFNNKLKKSVWKKPQELSDVDVDMLLLEHEAMELQQEMNTQYHILSDTNNSNTNNNNNNNNSDADARDDEEEVVAGYKHTREGIVQKSSTPRYLSDVPHKPAITTEVHARLLS